MPVRKMPDVSVKTISYRISECEERTENKKASRLLSTPIFRAAPGCDLACPKCEVMCAVLAAVRDDLWREAEQLHRERALSSGRVAAEDLEAALDQLANAEREFERARPRASHDRSAATAPRTFAPMRLH
jgi:hypothetical protein